MLAVRAVHEVPGRGRLLGYLEAVLHRPLDATVVRGLPQVPGGDTPARALVRTELPQAPALQLGADVEVHLDHGDAIRHQHPLEAADPLHFAPHDAAGTSGIENRAAQEVLVPARVQDRDPPARRHDAPVSPQGGALPLDFIRLAESIGR